jgi:hypothetical protein
MHEEGVSVYRYSYSLEPSSRQPGRHPIDIEIDVEAAGATAIVDWGPNPPSNHPPGAPYTVWIDGHFADFASSVDDGLQKISNRRAAAASGLPVDFSQELAGAARNLVAFAGRRPAGPPVNPPGLNTGVQLLGTKYRIGRLNRSYSSPADMLSHAEETPDPGRAAEILAGRWRAEIEAMPSDVAARATQVIFMTSVLPPP